MKIKKLQAFTLTELLVGMLLTVIVMGLAFSFLNLVNRNILSIQNNYSETTDKKLLQQKLRIDLHRYPIASYSISDDVLFLKNAIETIEYKFIEEMIVANNDTLVTHSKGKQLYQNGIEVEEGKVDAIKILFGANEDSNFLFISRRSDASQKISAPWGLK